MAVELVQYAYSFSHAIVTANERQYTDISAVSISQELTESAVYGTDIRPMKRSVGQLSMGRGQLTFSDMGEAIDFYKALGDEPFPVHAGLCAEHAERQLSQRRVPLVSPDVVRH
jgi:hypothetical protein